MTELTELQIQLKTAERKLKSAKTARKQYNELRLLLQSLIGWANTQNYYPMMAGLAKAGQQMFSSSHAYIESQVEYDGIVVNRLKKQIELESVISIDKAHGQK